MLAAMFALSLALPAEPGARHLTPHVPVDSPPAWFREGLADLVRGSGRWLADNSAHVSPQEPWEAYGQEWSWGLGKRSVKGRLYAVKGGKEAGTIWEYHVYWHPGEGRAVVEQFGSDGSFGRGYLSSDGNGGEWLDQTLHFMDGSTSRVGHQAKLEGDTRVTQSLTWSDGKWEKRRYYSWRRV